MKPSESYKVNSHFNALSHPKEIASTHAKPPSDSLLILYWMPLRLILCCSRYTCSIFRANSSTSSIVAGSIFIILYSYSYYGFGFLNQLPISIKVWQTIFSKDMINTIHYSFLVIQD